MMRKFDNSNSPQQISNKQEVMDTYSCGQSTPPQQKLKSQADIIMQENDTYMLIIISESQLFKEN